MEKKKRKMRVADLVGSPIVVRVPNNKTIEKGEIFKIKRFWFVACHDKMAYDGSLRIGAYVIGVEEVSS